MQETKDSPYNTGNPVNDAVRFVCDASYAVLPRDVAHKLADFEKNFLGGLRWLVDKNIQWIDDSLRRSDELREEWRRGHRASAPTEATGERPAESV